MPFKPAKTEALRTFVALDSDLVVSGLAALDGGAIDEILMHVTEDEQSQKGVHVGGRPIKAQASKNRGRKVQEEMLRKRTEHSAAASLIDRLMDMDAVGVVDGALDEEVASQLDTAVAISLGYLAGLRPGEWRALRWLGVRRTTLTVRDGTDTDGSLRGVTKTRHDRVVDLWPALADDLAEWRATTPFADDGDPGRAERAGARRAELGISVVGARRFQLVAAMDSRISRCSSRLSRKSGWCPVGLRPFGDASALCRV